MEINKLSASIEARNLLEDLWKIFDTKVFGSKSSERKFDVWMKTKYKDFKDCINALIPGKTMKYYRNFGRTPDDPSEPLYGYWYSYELEEDAKSDVRLKICICRPTGIRELTDHDKTPFYFFELLMETIKTKSFFIPPNAKPEDCEFTGLMMKMTNFCPVPLLV